MKVEVRVTNWWDFEYEFVVDVENLEEAYRLGLLFGYGCEPYELVVLSEDDA